MDAYWIHVGRTHLSAFLRAEWEIAARAEISVVLVEAGVAGKTDRLRKSWSGARHSRLFAEDYVASFQVTRCDQVPIPLTITSFVILIVVVTSTCNVLYYY